MFKTEGGWQCGQPGCGYVANKWSLRNHVESKHISIGGVQCDQCSKVCPTRHALTMHIKRNHPFWKSKLAIIMSHQLCILVLDPDIENQISQLMIKTENGWHCGQPGCEYIKSSKVYVRNHIESKHIDIGGVQCDYCSKVCLTRNALTMHIKRKHFFQ